MIVWTHTVTNDTTITLSICTVFSIIIKLGLYISDQIKFLLCNSDKFKIRLFFQFAFNCFF